MDTDDVLSHYGIKGMKWGQRKDRGEKGDKKWAKKALGRNRPSNKEIVAVYNEASRRINRDIPALNDNPRFRGRDLRNPSPLRDQYHEAAEAMVQRHMRDAAREAWGTNPSGTQQYAITTRIVSPSSMSIDLELVDVEHEESSRVGEIIFELDPLGYMTKLISFVPDEPLEHADISEEFLESDKIKEIFATKVSDL